MRRTSTRHEGSRVRYFGAPPSPAVELRPGHRSRSHSEQSSESDASGDESSARGSAARPRVRQPTSRLLSMGDVMKDSPGLRPMLVSPAAGACPAVDGVLPAAGCTAFPESSSEDDFPSLSPQPRAPFVDEVRFGSPALDHPDRAVADVTSWFSPADADGPAAQRARTGPSPAAPSLSTTPAWDLRRGGAAVRLQSAWRRVLAQRRAGHLTHIRDGIQSHFRILAAILIQCCARRRQARLLAPTLTGQPLFYFLLAQRREEARVHVRAGIQAHVTVLAASLIQRCVRRRQACIHAVRHLRACLRRRAAIQIQSVLRRLQSQRRCAFLSQIGPVPRFRARAQLWYATHELIRAHPPCPAVWLPSGSTPTIADCSPPADTLTRILLVVDDPGSRYSGTVSLTELTGGLNQEAGVGDPGTRYSGVGSSPLDPGTHSSLHPGLEPRPTASPSTPSTSRPSTPSSSRRALHLGSPATPPAVLTTSDPVPTATLPHRPRKPGFDDGAVEDGRGVTGVAGTGGYDGDDDCEDGGRRPRHAPTPRYAVGYVDVDVFSDSDDSVDYTCPAALLSMYPSYSPEGVAAAAAGGVCIDCAPLEERPLSAVPRGNRDPLLLQAALQMALHGRPSQQPPPADMARLTPMSSTSGRPLCPDVGPKLKQRGVDLVLDDADAGRLLDENSCRAAAFIQLAGRHFHQRIIDKYPANFIAVPSSDGESRHMLLRLQRLDGHPADGEFEAPGPRDGAFIATAEDDEYYGLPYCADRSCFLEGPVAPGPVWQHLWLPLQPLACEAFSVALSLDGLLWRHLLASSDVRARVANLAELHFGPVGRPALHSALLGGAGLEGGWYCGSARRWSSDAVLGSISPALRAVVLMARAHVSGLSGPWRRVDSSSSTLLCSLAKRASVLGSPQLDYDPLSDSPGHTDTPGLLNCYDADTPGLLEQADARLTEGLATLGDEFAAAARVVHLRRFEALSSEFGLSRPGSGRGSLDRRPPDLQQDARRAAVSDFLLDVGVYAEEQLNDGRGHLRNLLDDYDDARWSAHPSPLRKPLVVNRWTRIARRLRLRTYAVPLLMGAFQTMSAHALEDLGLPANPLDAATEMFVRMLEKQELILEHADDAFEVSLESCSDSDLSQLSDALEQWPEAVIAELSESVSESFRRRSGAGVADAAALPGAMLAAAFADGIHEVSSHHRLSNEIRQSALMSSGRFPVRSRRPPDRLLTDDVGMARLIIGGLSAGECQDVLNHSVTFLSGDSAQSDGGHSQGEERGERLDRIGDGIHRACTELGTVLRCDQPSARPDLLHPDRSLLSAPGWPGVASDRFPFGQNRCRCAVCHVQVPDSVAECPCCRHFCCNSCRRRQPVGEVAAWLDFGFPDPAVFGDATTDGVSVASAVSMLRAAFTRSRGCGHCGHLLLPELLMIRTIRRTRPAAAGLDRGGPVVSPNRGLWDQPARFFFWVAVAHSDCDRTVQALGLHSHPSGSPAPSLLALNVSFPYNEVQATSSATGRVDRQRVHKAVQNLIERQLGIRVSSDYGARLEVVGPHGDRALPGGSQGIFHDGRSEHGVLFLLCLDGSHFDVDPAEWSRDAISASDFCTDQLVGPTPRLLPSTVMVPLGSSPSARGRVGGSSMSGLVRGADGPATALLHEPCVLLDATVFAALSFAVNDDGAPTRGDWRGVFCSPGRSTPSQALFSALRQAASAPAYGHRHSHTLTERIRVDKRAWAADQDRAATADRGDRGEDAVVRGFLKTAEHGGLIRPSPDQHLPPGERLFGQDGEQLGGNRIPAADPNDLNSAMTSCQDYVTDGDVVVTVRVMSSVFATAADSSVPHWYPATFNVTVRLDAGYNSTHGVHQALSEYFIRTPASGVSCGVTVVAKMGPFPEFHLLTYRCHRPDGPLLDGNLDEVPGFGHGCVVLCSMRGADGATPAATSSAAPDRFGRHTPVSPGPAAGRPPPPEPGTPTSRFTDIDSPRIPPRAPREPTAPVTWHQSGVLVLCGDGSPETDWVLLPTPADKGHSSLFEAAPFSSADVVGPDGIHDRAVALANEALFNQSAGLFDMPDSVLSALPSVSREFKSRPDLGLPSPVLYTCFIVRLPLYRLHSPAESPPISELFSGNRARIQAMGAPRGHRLLVTANLTAVRGSDILESAGVAMSAGAANADGVATSACALFDMFDWPAVVAGSAVAMILLAGHTLARHWSSSVLELLSPELAMEWRLVPASVKRASCDTGAVDASLTDLCARFHSFDNRIPGPSPSAPTSPPVSPPRDRFDAATRIGPRASGPFLDTTDGAFDILLLDNRPDALRSPGESAAYVMSVLPNTSFGDIREALLIGGVRPPGYTVLLRGSHPRAVAHLDNADFASPSAGILLRVPASTGPDGRPLHPEVPGLRSLSSQATVAAYLGFPAFEAARTLLIDWECTDNDLPSRRQLSTSPVGAPPDFFDPSLGNSPRDSSGGGESGKAPSEVPFSSTSQRESGASQEFTMLQSMFDEQSARSAQMVTVIEGLSDRLDASNLADAKKSSSGVGSKVALPGGGSIPTRQLAAAGVPRPPPVASLEKSVYMDAAEGGNDGRVSGTSDHTGGAILKSVTSEVMDQDAGLIKAAGRLMPPEAINLQLSGLRKQGENQPVSDYWSDTMVDALDGIHKGVHRVRILDVWLKGVRPELRAAWESRKSTKRHSRSVQQPSEVVAWLIEHTEWAEAVFAIGATTPYFADRLIELPECLYFMFSTDPCLADQKRLKLESDFKHRTRIPVELFLVILSDGRTIESTRLWDMRWGTWDEKQMEVDASFMFQGRLVAIMRVYSCPAEVVEAIWAEIGDTGFDSVTQYEGPLPHGISEVLHRCIRTVTAGRRFHLSKSVAARWSAVSSYYAAASRPTRRPSSGRGRGDPSSSLHFSDAELEDAPFAELTDYGPVADPPTQQLALSDSQFYGNDSESMEIINLLYSDPRTGPAAVSSYARGQETPWALPDPVNFSAEPPVGHKPQRDGMPWFSVASATEHLYRRPSGKPPPACDDVMCLRKECLQFNDSILQMNKDRGRVIPAHHVWSCSHNRSGCPFFLAEGLGLLKDKAIRNREMGAEYMRRRLKQVLHVAPFGPGSRFNNKECAEELRTMQKQFITDNLKGGRMTSLARA